MRPCESCQEEDRMKEVYIAAAARTAIGKIGGTLKTVQPEEYAELYTDEEAPDPFSRYF